MATRDSLYNLYLLCSDTLPRKSTLFEIPRLSAILERSCWYGPDPATSSFTSGDRPMTCVSALKASCNPLYFISLLTHPIVFGERSLSFIGGKPGFVHPGSITSMFFSRIPQPKRSRAVLREAATILDFE